MICIQSSRLTGLLALILLAASVAPARADYPKPSPYPISWNLNLDSATPTRVVVNNPDGSPQAYWYLTYSVTNNTNQERMFLPLFELLTNDGQIIRSDNNIPMSVFNQIKKQEKRRYLESFPSIEGSLRLGEDQSKDGVAIWREPSPRMGQFTIFVSGLSGETAPIKDPSGKPINDAQGNPIILRKTLQLNYTVRGDETATNTPAVETSRDSVMR